MGMLTSKKGYAQRRGGPLEKLHVCDGNCFTVSPIGVRGRKGWLLKPLIEVWWNVNLRMQMRGV